MAWKKRTVTTANNTTDVTFKGRGSIYADGTFGGGVLELHIIDSTGAVSTGFVDDALDGATVKSIDCPSGDYQLQLTGSTGATVNIYCNDQINLDKKVN